MIVTLTAEKNKRGRKWKKLLCWWNKEYVHCDFEQDFTIDQDDYHVLCKIFPDEVLDADSVRSMVDIQENDVERRVHKVRTFCVRNHRLLEPVKDLPHLQALDLSYAFIDTLPPWMNQLQNLQALNLHSSGIRFLPPFLGVFRQLQELNLSHSPLASLPEEIGELVNLTKLNLESSGITSLPPAIGRLTNLTELDLYCTRKLSGLPHEIGHLTSLKILHLACSEIACLPPSIGQLQNLEELHLNYTTNLTQLPKDIGNLTSLKILALSQNSDPDDLPKFVSIMSSLPNLVARMGNLKLLDLNEYCFRKDHEKSVWESLCMVTECSPLLGSLGEMDYFLEREYFYKGCASKYPESKTIVYKLSCNRARWRTGFAGTTRMAPNLWPRLLESATRAFNREGRSTRFVSTPEAIYQLLVDGRGSFVDAITAYCVQ